MVEVGVEFVLIYPPCRVSAFSWLVPRLLVSRVTLIMMEQPRLYPEQLSPFALLLPWPWPLFVDLS